MKVQPPTPRGNFRAKPQISKNQQNLNWGMSVSAKMLQINRPSNTELATWLCFLHFLENGCSGEPFRGLSHIPKFPKTHFRQLDKTYAGTYVLKNLRAKTKSDRIYIFTPSPTARRGTFHYLVKYLQISLSTNISPNSEKCPSVGVGGAEQKNLVAFHFDSQLQ